MKPVWLNRYVHRDLKPKNIRINNKGRAVVLDFGIARALDEGSLTITGAQPLSWPYASPEQFEGKKSLISYKTDFFSLGVIAYELFTGSLPFGDSKGEVERRMGDKDLQFTKINNPELNKFCEATLIYNSSERPRHADTLTKILRP